MPTYIVTIADSIEADDAATAVTTFVELFVQHGLRDWRYHVHDVESGFIGVFDGHGEQQDLTVYLPPVGAGDDKDRGEENTRTESDEPAPEPPTEAEAEQPQETEDDAVLLALAESLNNTAGDRNG